jgi:putative transposase
VKFDFVAKHRGAWPNETLCEAIIAYRSGFYAWLSRPRLVLAAHSGVVDAGEHDISVGG